MVITVVICTWNRSRILRRALQGLRAMQVPASISWELLVVNNNCTDDTTAVVKEHAACLPIREVFEPAQGLAFARNCALRAARGDLVLFADDDCIVSSRWADAYVRAARNFPSAAVFGGPIVPLFEAAPSSLIAESEQVQMEIYGKVRRSESTRILGPCESVFGGNFAIRSAIGRAFFFNTDLGRIASSRIGGEEIDLYNRLTAAGHRAVWVSDADVEHIIPPENVTLRFVWRSYCGLGQSAVRMGDCGNARCAFGIPLWAVRQLGEGALETLTRLPFKRKRSAKPIRDAAIALGVIRESFARRANRKPARGRVVIGR